jgi:acyl carrier protein
MSMPACFLRNGKTDRATSDTNCPLQFGGTQIMNQDQVFQKVVEILTKYSKSDVPPEQITMETSILDDLKVNSARLVDIVLDFEDAFDIEVDDDDADKVATVGDGVNLIMAKI